MIGGAKGIGIGIDFGIPNQYCRATNKPYIEKDVLDSLRVVASAYGKSNDDADRSIVKNLVDASNPFVISNAAFKLNSGFGEYKEDFTTWSKVAGTSIITDSKYVLTDEKAITNAGYFLWNRLAKDSFKVKISNIPNGGWMSYRYRITKEDTQFSSLFIREDGIYTLPATVAGSDVDFFISTASAPAKDWVGLTITQIPSFEGAFVTDGIDDLITSTKTVQEMLGGSNEITVVSMIHQIGLIQVYGLALTNYIRNNGGYLRSAVNSVGKTGIYGYTANNLNQSIKDRVKVINTILGDKKDYTASISDSYVLDDSLFHVQNYVHDGIIAGDGSQLAWYWTIIANKVLTTDQINQVIAYFNLDRTLKPDILCNTIKQGITNENHAEFGDKLIDFSGNGRDIQLNNIGWKGDSGIGKYSADFESFDWVTDVIKKTSTQAIIGVGGRFCNHTAIEIDEMKVNIEGNVTDLRYWYIANPDDTTRSEIRLTSGINTLPKSYAKDDGQTYNIGFAYISGDSEITIEQIPSHAGALCLDGVNDFGKVTGMPVYKDYTIIADYERFYLEPITGGRASILSKSSKVGNGSFIFNLEDQNGDKACYTFGEANGNISDDITRIIRYQSKYYNTKTLGIGTAKDNDFMVLGKVREADSRYFCGAIYSLMSFPYSMSEFLIERQLKKHKLGTLYPNMVEFRPIIKSNVNYQDIIFRNTSTGENLIVGQYYNLESISIYVKLLYYEEVSTIKVNNINAEFNSYDKNTGYYRFDCIVTKSPQKINLTIEQDENYVQWNPVVESNAEYSDIAYLNYSHYVATINVGDYINVGDTVGIRVILNSTIDEVVNCKVNGQECEIVNVSPRVFDCKFTLTSESPQKINITIYQPPEYLTMLSNSTLISNETLIKNE